VKFFFERKGNLGSKATSRAYGFDLGDDRELSYCSGGENYHAILIAGPE